MPFTLWRKMIILLFRCIDLMKFFPWQKGPSWGFLDRRDITDTKAYCIVNLDIHQSLLLEIAADHSGTIDNYPVYTEYRDAVNSDIESVIVSDVLIKSFLDPGLETPQFITSSNTLIQTSTSNANHQSHHGHIEGTLNLPEIAKIGIYESVDDEQWGSSNTTTVEGRTVTTAVIKKRGEIPLAVVRGASRLIAGKKLVDTANTRIYNATGIGKLGMLISITI